jgi:short-subunit dehydrogenase
MVDRERYGPWALLAGGSEGVGAEFATQLAADGFDLVLLARKPAPLEETAAACRELGARVRTLAVDLTEPDAVERVLATTEGLEIGLLILNAGANTHSAEFLDGDLAAFGRVVTLNVTTPMALVHHYGGPMRERGRGGIVLVGSMASYLGSTRHTVYGGVKAFSRIFAESLWLELREHGVDVLELVLGVTRTPAMERVGLDFEVPGMKVAEPADVAREGLEHLAAGPVHLAAGNDEYLAMRTHPDRAKVVLGAHRFIQSLMGLTPAEDESAADR